MAALTVRIPRLRYLRRALADVARRSRHRRRTRRWLGERSETLDGTGAAATLAVAAEAAVPASGTLTLTGNAQDTETVTIGDVVYTFQASLVDEPNNVLVGASASDSLDNLIAAINADAGAGTLYGTGTVVHPDVLAVAGAGDTMDLTALVAGRTGNDIETTETLANGSFGDATLTGGENADTLTITAHGYSTGAGPFHVETDDELPDGLAEDTRYWVSVVDEDTVHLHRSQRDALLGQYVVDILDAGTGNHTLVPATTEQAIAEHVRQGVLPTTMNGLTDIDDVI